MKSILRTTIEFEAVALLGIALYAAWKVYRWISHELTTERGIY